MQHEAVNARYDDLHKDRPFHDGEFRVWSDKRSDMTPFHYREGVTIWVAREDYTPDDDFLAQRQSLAQEPPGDLPESDHSGDDSGQPG